MTHTRTRIQLFIYITAIVLLQTLHPAAVAETRRVTMDFSDPGNAGTVTVTFTDTAKAENDPNRTKSVPVVIPQGTNATGKRDLILAELKKAGYTAKATRFPNSLFMDYIDKNVEVGFDPGETMESDVVECSAPVDGGIRFEGFFEPFDLDGNPAVFSAGVITDLGEVYCEVRADELGFNTEGFQIIAELAARMQPQVLPIGADVFPDGEILRVAFQPPAVLGTGGVQAGTTSPSEGSGGFLLLGLPRLLFEMDQLIAGEHCSMRAGGAAANETIHFIYSVKGTGELFVPSLNVEIDLLKPILIASKRADANGDAEINPPVPAGAQGLSVALQALIQEGVSPVVLQTVE